MKRRRLTTAEKAARKRARVQAARASLRKNPIKHLTGFITSRGNRKLFWDPSMTWGGSKWRSRMRRRSDASSTEYYAAHPEARRKKVAKQAEINRRPEELQRRAALTRERRKRGIAGKGGPDVSHTSSGGTVLEDPSTNRGRNGHGRRPRLKRDSIWAEGFTPDLL